MNRHHFADIETAANTLNSFVDIEVPGVSKEDIIDSELVAPSRGGSLVFGTTTRTSSEAQYPNTTLLTEVRKPPSL